MITKLAVKVPAWPISLPRIEGFQEFKIYSKSAVCHMRGSKALGIKENLWEPSGYILIKPHSTGVCYYIKVKLLHKYQDNSQNFMGKSGMEQEGKQEMCNHRVL